jgi:hypothetical protein
MNRLEKANSLMIGLTLRSFSVHGSIKQVLCQWLDRGFFEFKEN